MQAPPHSNHMRHERPAARDRPAADDEAADIEVHRHDEPIVPAQPWTLTSRIERPDLQNLDGAYNLAWWLMHSDEHANEVVQEAILEAMALRGATNLLDSKSRLMAIVRRVCYARLQTTVADVEDEAEQARHADEGHANEGATRAKTNRRGQIDAALQRLPIEFREVIVLRDMEDLSYTAISFITGVPVCAVVSRLGLARARLAWHLRR